MTGRGAHLLELLFPSCCAACDRLVPPGEALCAPCQAQASPLPQAHCARCAEPGVYGERGCPRCTAQPPPFAAAFAPFLHEGPIARAVHRLKYEDHPGLARPLGALLAERARAVLAGWPGGLCAIPLHRRRFVWRRFDQAWLLSEELRRRTGREALPHALARIRATARQVGLEPSARERNVAGAFRAAEAVRGRPWVLVDDVLTTGATARAAAQALLEAGATEVRVLTLARACREL